MLSLHPQATNHAPCVITNKSSTLLNRRNRENRKKICLYSECKPNASPQQTRTRRKPLTLVKALRTTTAQSPFPLRVSTAQQQPLCAQEVLPHRRLLVILQPCDAMRKQPEALQPHICTLTPHWERESCRVNSLYSGSMCATGLHNPYLWQQPPRHNGNVLIQGVH